MNTFAMSALGRIDVNSNVLALGQIGRFQDTDPTIVDGNPVPLGQVPVYAIYVMNDSGGVLAPGEGCTFKSGALGKRVDAKSGANAICHGVVDPWLASNVPNGSYFWLIIQGPCDVLVGAANLSANAVVQTAASGTFITGTAGTNPIGHCGYADEAGTNGNRARVFFNSAFSPIKP